MPENPLSNAHVVVPSAPSDEPEDNPYRAADAVVPGADVLPPAAIAEDAWDEGHAAGFAAAVDHAEKRNGMADEPVTSQSRATGPVYHLCKCCTAHGGGDRMLPEPVTCPECGQLCSCEGCAADAWLAEKEERAIAAVMAFREAVEALREEGRSRGATPANDYAEGQCVGWGDAVDFLERRFLTSEGEPDDA